MFKRVKEKQFPNRVKVLSELFLKINMDSRLSRGRPAGECNPLQGMKGMNLAWLLLFGFGEEAWFFHQKANRRERDTKNLQMLKSLMEILHFLSHKL